MSVPGQTGIQHTVKTYGNYHNAKAAGVLASNSQNPVTSGSGRRANRRNGDRRVTKQAEDGKQMVKRKF